jgi:hypothetical protein
MSENRERFEISLIDFEKGIFQKYSTDDSNKKFILDLSNQTIKSIDDHLPGLITFTGDLSPITEARENLTKKAVEDFLKQIAKINNI